jgi:chromate reductase
MAAIKHAGMTPVTAGRRADLSDSLPSATGPDPDVPRDGRSRAGAIRVLGIAGSLRRDSCNRRLLQAARRNLPAGAQMIVYDALKELPPFDEADELRPAPAVVELRRKIADADALLISTPEYNGSLPGQLKNALDWASRPFATNVLRDKPVAVIGASPSPGGAAHANADARRILARIGARVIDRRLLVAHAFAQLQRDGELADAQLRAQLSDVVSALVAAGAHHPPRPAQAA